MVNKTTMRRSRNRRGSSKRLRLVRKNKTMKGGWGSIKADTFKKEGYLYAANTLENTNKPEYKFIPNDIPGNMKKAAVIKNAYSKYVISLPTSNKQIVKWAPSASSPGGARPPLNMLSGENKTKLLEPADFNKTIDDIASGAAAKFSGFIFVSTNQKYVDFGRSFKQFAGEDITGNVTSAGSVAAGLLSKGVSAAPGKLTEMANSTQAAAAKTVALQGAKQGATIAKDLAGNVAGKFGSFLKNKL